MESLVNGTKDFKKTLAWIAQLALLCLASVVFMGKSDETLLRGIDSNIHAAVAMGVTSQGARPRLPMPLRPYQSSGPSVTDPAKSDTVFNDHPFFLFWANGLIMRAFGPSAWTARLLTGAFSVGAVALTLSIGTLLGGQVFGLLAAIFLVFCRDFVLTSATMSLDTALVFFILLSFFFWLKRRWLALGLAAGVGLWMKTPVVLLVFPTALITDLLERVPRTELKARTLRLIGAGAVALFVGSLLWIYTGYAGGWDLVKDYWVRQLWGTAVGGRTISQGTQWDFFFYYVRTGFLPGLPFLIWALIKIARERRYKERAFVIPAVATLILAALVTGMRFKLGHYVTPAFPFLALISAYSLRDLASRHEEKLYAGVAALSLLLLAALLVFPIHLGPEAFIALKRFMPLIQKHGDCDDVIALIPGGEPAGGDLDYRLVLNFYTSHPTQTLDCHALAEKIDAGYPPPWLILAQDNLEPCLPAARRARYSAAYLSGNQYLFTTRIAHSDVTDLTPMELELSAVTDCRAKPYPKDIWHKYVSGEAGNP